MFEQRGVAIMGRAVLTFCLDGVLALPYETAWKYL